jgi:subtilisin family serine protease
VPAGAWGIDRIDQEGLPLDRTFYYPDEAGEDVDIYVIDTGIRTTHQEFGDRAVWGTTQNPDGGDVDCQGHGTHVAGTAAGASYGVAKKANLIAVKVLGCTNSGSWSQIIGGIDWTTEEVLRTGRKSVANLSLGGSFTASVNAATQALVDAGCVSAIAAMNNNGQNACNYSPAAVADAITVMSTDQDDRVSSFSNIGTCCDIAAPGRSILSAYYTSDTSTYTMSGTSMATPLVVGVAATIMSMSSEPMSTDAVFREIQNLSFEGKITGNIGGAPNLLLYNGREDLTPPPPPAPTVPPPPSPYQTVATGMCGDVGCAELSTEGACREAHQDSFPSADFYTGTWTADANPDLCYVNQETNEVYYNQREEATPANLIRQKICRCDVSPSPPTSAPPTTDPPTSVPCFTSSLLL